MAVGITSIKGVQTVLNNVNRELDKIKDRSMRGLIEAQIQIRRDMDLVPPKIPVDSGNLRASYFVVTTSGAWMPGTTGGSTTARFKGDKAGELATGHGRVSAYYKGVANASRNMLLIMGFTAYYAVYVHENMTALNWNRDGSGPKFFESALKANERKIVATVAKYARIK